MANTPFDRVIYNSLERAEEDDVNLGGSEIEAALREFAFRQYQGRGTVGGTAVSGVPVDRTQALSAGFVGEGFKVRAASPSVLSVIVSAGLGFMDLAAGTVVNGDSAIVTNLSGISGLNDLHRYKPMVLPSDTVIAGIPAGDPVNPRIDIVEVLVDRRRIDPQSRDFLNTATATFVSTPGTLKTLTWQPTVGVPSVGASTTGIGYKTGTPAAVPVAPVATPGYVIIASIFVPTLAAGILDFGGIGSPAGIRDERRMRSPNGIIPVSAVVTHGTPALMNYVVAPPGVVVGINRVSAVATDIVISAGAVQVGVASIGGSAATALVTSFVVILVTQVLHDAMLTGASVSPTVGMAVGQQVAVIGTSGGTIVNVNATLRTF